MEVIESQIKSKFWAAFSSWRVFSLTFFQNPFNLEYPGTLSPGFLQPFLLFSTDWGYYFCPLASVRIHVGERISMMRGT